MLARVCGIANINFQVPSQHLIKALLVDGFSQVFIAAGKPVVGNVFRHHIGGQCDNGRIYPGFPQRGGGIAPVHHRHLNVHQNHVERLSDSHLQSFGAVAHMHKLSAGATHQQRDQAAVYVVVLRTEYAP